jgi:hypothetical protein
VVLVVLAVQLDRAVCQAPPGQVCVIFEARRKGEHVRVGEIRRSRWRQRRPAAAGLGRACHYFFL